MSALVAKKKSEQPNLENKKVDLEQYVLMEVPSNGDCMFTSILEASKDAEKAPGTTFVRGRRKAKDCVGSFRIAVARHLSKDTTFMPAPDFPRSMKSQQIKLIRDGAWGNDVIASKITQMYNLSIAIVSEPLKMVINGVDLSDDCIILLFRNGNHYDWLKPKEMSTPAMKVAMTSNQFKF